MDRETHIALKGAEIRVIDTTLTTLTDEEGRFVIEVPRRHRYLIVTRDNYIATKIPLAPGFQHKNLKAYMESMVIIENEVKKINQRDSLYMGYKNAISLSLMEIPAVAIALRYERFIRPHHSIGLHGSHYVYGHSFFTDMLSHDGPYHTNSTYTGFKAATFYRFYPYRKGTLGVFLDAKVPFGYFYFNNLEYQYSPNNYRTLSTTHSFWTWGCGISAGLMFALPKTNHGVVNLSIGYQYFPIVKGPPYLQETFVYPDYTTTLTHYTDYRWWYELGPGARFEIKFTIGGIF